ncbi:MULTISPECIES: membrane protein [unclassified Streptomyces]|uniref:SLAC1 family transporter n=1 Tax=unclassified Streptomyces TaxID=2593676 RepID=UPI0004BD630E|nr:MULTISPECIES: membrane protein [unclassified Streptomyces]
MPAPSSFATWWEQRAPAASAAALATCTLTVGLDLAGYEVLSRVFLGLGCAAWLMLAADFTLRLLRAGARWRVQVRMPSVLDSMAAAALTTVAATAVLGTGFSAAGSPSLAATLLVPAVLLWPVPLALPAQDGERRRPGTVFARCVATQGLAVLGAALAAAESAAWLAHGALVLFWLGLVLYVLALARFDVRQVAEGLGDHWLAGGALALSALAGAQLLTADSARLYLWNDDARGVLRTATVTLLVLALAWYAVLLAAEFVWPRPRTDIRRWATVFTWAVSGVAALAVAAALDVGWLDGPGEALLWVAVAGWLCAAARAVTAVRAGVRPGPVRSRARR